MALPISSTPWLNLCEAINFPHMFTRTPDGKLNVSHKLPRILIRMIASEEQLEKRDGIPFPFVSGYLYYDESIGWWKAITAYTERRIHYARPEMFEWKPIPEGLE